MKQQIKLAEFISNSLEMPYCKNDIAERIIKKIPIPCVGEIKALNVVVSNRLCTGINFYAQLCNVEVIKITGLNEQDCEISVKGGSKNLEILNTLAKGYKPTEIKDKF